MTDEEEEESRRKRDKEVEKILRGRLGPDGPRTGSAALAFLGALIVAAAAGIAVFSMMMAGL